MLMRRERLVGGVGGLSSKNKKKSIRMKKEEQEWSQPRMRLDLPPGGFLRPPLAALAPPDGAEGCGCSWSSCSTSPSSRYSSFGSWPFSPSRLSFQTMAAPELWMVVSSG